MNSPLKSDLLRRRPASPEIGGARASRAAGRPQLVAHVMPWSSVGGTELATHRIIRALDGAPYQHVAVCREDAPEVQRFFREHGVPVETFDAFQLWSGPVGFVRGTLRLRRTFRRLGVDIVHCADLVAGDLAACAARTAGSTLICHVRNRYGWLNRWQRAWLAMAHRLAFVSRDTRQRFGDGARHFGSNVERNGVVVYDGVACAPPPDPATAAESRASVRREFSLGAEHTIVCMVARIARQKDHLTLVEAAERVVPMHPQARFLLVGGWGAEPEERRHAESVLQRIAASPVRDHFIQAGFRTDVSRLMAGSDVFALCTHHEGLPLVILEAMSLGRPIVATAVDGVPEVVLDGRTGLLHGAGDAGALAEHLLALLRDPALAARMGDAGRALVQDRFSEASFAAGISRLYDDAVREHRGSPR